MSIGLTLGLNLGRGGAVAQSVGALAPDAVSGLALWLKADSLSLNDGDAVSTWADQSGHGRDFTGTGANRPIYKAAIVNGKPVVRFAAASTQYLVSAAVDLSGAIAATVFLVVKPTTAGALYALLEHSADPTANTNGFAITRTASNGIEVYTKGASLTSVSGTSVASGAYTVTTGTRLVTALIDKSRTLEETAVWVNGAWFAGLEGSSTGRSADNNSGAALGNFAFYLGARGGATSPLDGDVAEVLVYDRALTARERVRVAWHLNDTYDLFS